MNKAKIVVLVSGGGTNLQALIDAERNGIIKSGNVQLVISSRPGVFALERAEKAGIPNIALDRSALGSQESFENEIQRLLIENEIDLIVLAGFLSILSSEFTTKWANRIINVHPSLIPSFCGKGMYGLKVHEAALAKGVKVTGATVHFVNEIPDGGRILLQKAVEIMDEDTPEELQYRVMKQAEWIILPQATEMVSKMIMTEKE